MTGKMITKLLSKLPFLDYRATLRPTCLCFSHGNAIFQLISHKFLIGLCIVCLRAKAHNLHCTFHHLFIGCRN